MGSVIVEVIKVCIVARKLSGMNGSLDIRQHNQGFNSGVAVYHLRYRVLIKYCVFPLKHGQ